MTAEWRTKRPNARARLRRTGFVKVGFTICSWLKCVAGPAATYNELPNILRQFADDCLTVVRRSVLILVGNSSPRTFRLRPKRCQQRFYDCRDVACYVLRCEPQ